MMAIITLFLLRNLSKNSKNAISFHYFQKEVYYLAMN